MSRQLVITADDLGVDPATNATIVELLREGLVTASALIPVAPAADDAARRVLDAGVAVPSLHVTLTSAREYRPWRPLAADVPTLTDPRGYFFTSAAIVERVAARPHVTREMAAQLDWMHAAGLRPGALDSHSGVLYGMRGRSLAGAAVTFCAEHHLAFRMPRRLSRSLGLAVRGLRGHHEAALAQADARGVSLPEVTVGPWLPGRALVSYAHLRAHVLTQLRRLPPGTSELILHPAPESAAARLAGSEGRKRVWELRLLRDPALARTLERAEIRPVPHW